ILLIDTHYASGSMTDEEFPPLFCNRYADPLTDGSNYGDRSVDLALLPRPTGEHVVLRIHLCNDVGHTPSEDRIPIVDDLLGEDELVYFLHRFAEVLDGRPILNHRKALGRHPSSQLSSLKRIVATLPDLHQ